MSVTRRPATFRPIPRPFEFAPGCPSRAPTRRARPECRNRRRRPATAPGRRARPRRRARTCCRSARPSCPGGCRPPRSARPRGPGPGCRPGSSTTSRPRMRCERTTGESTASRSTSVTGSSPDRDSNRSSRVRSMSSRDSSRCRSMAPRWGVDATRWEAATMPATVLATSCRSTSSARTCASSSSTRRFASSSLVIEPRTSRSAVIPRSRAPPMFSVAETRLRQSGEATGLLSTLATAIAANAPARPRVAHAGSGTRRSSRTASTP